MQLDLNDFQWCTHGSISALLPAVGHSSMSSCSFTIFSVTGVEEAAVELVEDFGLTV